MPRATQSVESRILTYFRTAPLDAVELLYGLVREQVRARTPPAKVKHRKAKAKPAGVAATAHAAPAGKKSHKKKPAKPAADLTTVDSF